LTTTSTATGVVSSSPSKEKVALSIKITPQINKISNFVKMKVEAKLDSLDPSAVPQALQNQTFGTQSRTATTTVVVADKDTVVLGGLTRDVETETVKKIPILGDIPILGWLFKSSQAQKTKTNLLVFLTPRIIREYEGVRAVLDKKLKERDDFLETNTGGDDAARKQRDDVIRSLPDLTNITKKPASGAVLEAPSTDPNTPAGEVPPVGDVQAPQGSNNLPGAPVTAPPPPPPGAGG
jgi:type II secretory pathway component GspD/PulD (secretin)